MLVYRLENTDGTGPFSGALYEFMSSNYHCNTERFPSTYFAFSMHVQDRVRDKPHGCLCLRQLLYWFPAKVIRKMREKGFGVAVYEVPGQDVIFGKFQLVFDPTNAKRVQFK